MNKLLGYALELLYALSNKILLKLLLILVANLKIKINKTLFIKFIFILYCLLIICDMIHYFRPSWVNRICHKNDPLFFFITFRHLFLRILKIHNLTRFRSLNLRDINFTSKTILKSLSNQLSQFQMLFLILSNRNYLSIIK